MLVITSAVKVLSIVSNDHKKWDVILAVPTADGAFVELPASVWVKPNRIVEPEEDGGYFCVAAIMDAKSSDLQVYTFQPLPDWTEPCPAQVSLTGIISTVQEDSAKLGYRVYRDGVEAHRSVTITRPGGWKTRRSVLVKGAVLEVVGELLSLDEVEVSNFYLTGATARLPTITSAASTSRAQVWGRKPQSAADSPVRKHRSAGCDSATALDSSATFSSPSSSYSYPSGSPEPSRSPPAKKHTAALDFIKEEMKKFEITKVSIKDGNEMKTLFVNSRKMNRVDVRSLPMDIRDAHMKATDVWMRNVSVEELEEAEEPLPKRTRLE